MRTFSDERPRSLMPLGDGNWHYNFNIHTELAPKMFDEEPREQYVFDTVYIEGKPTAAKITDAMWFEGFTRQYIDQHIIEIEKAVNQINNLKD